MNVTCSRGGRGNPLTFTLTVTEGQELRAHLGMVQAHNPEDRAAAVIPSHRGQERLPNSQTACKPRHLTHVLLRLLLGWSPLVGGTQSAGGRGDTTVTKQRVG